MSNPESVERRILRSTKKLSVRMGKEPLILVPENPAVLGKVEQYPCLNGNNNKIRFNPFTGEIFISTYRDSEKRQQAKQPTEIILMQRGNNPSRKIARRWARYPDIECAIRSSEHVLERYSKKGGVMVQNTLGVIDLTKRFLDLFESGQVNKDNLKGFMYEAAVELTRCGFAETEKPIRQELADQIIKAAAKDSLDRFNPLISRTRLTSAWVKAIKELLFAKKVREKFSLIEVDLLGERAAERIYLAHSLQLINEVIRAQNISELNPKISILKSFFISFLTPETIKVVPYRKAALVSRYILFGVNDSEEKLFEAIFIDKQERLEIQSYIPIDKIMEHAIFAKNAFGEIRERLMRSSVFVNNALEKGDRDLESKGH